MAERMQSEYMAMETPTQFMSDLLRVLKVCSAILQMLLQVCNGAIAALSCTGEQDGP